ncbi:flagellar motor switch protein FliM [Plastorhodobacter daqingensis]|uniref:Flagellar motor switch protein FliM n=1 Tax=Plastorhodobacter daqingensis TaxID=1387281 RepID=A0ABW2UNW1_9RHOB
MVSSRKLSAEEVEALVGGLFNMDEDETTGRTEDGQDVRPYTFGGNDLSLMGDYYALRMINERFCRLARSVFLPMLRITPRISSFPPEVKTFDEYRDGIDNFVSLTTSRIEELRGNQLIVIAPSFISLLTESYYGGRARPLRNSRGEFTATEQRVLSIITQGLNQALQLAWRDLVPLTFTIQSTEENLQFASFVDGGDMVINCSFMVQLPESDPASFDILYPVQTLKPLASQLRSRVQSDFVDDDMSWRDKLERAILSIPLTLTARLAEPTVPLRRLLHLQSGEVFPIQIGEAIEVHVENRRIFDAEMGEIGGRAALNLKTRHTS